MFVDYSLSEIEELRIAEKHPKAKILEPVKRLLDTPNMQKAQPQQSKEQTLKVDIKKLSQICPVRRYTTGTKLFYEGDYSNEMFLIAQGMVWLTTDGMLIKSLEASDLVGEISLISGGVNYETAEFISDGVALVINKENYSNAILLEPALGVKLLNSLATYTQKLTRELADLKS